MSTKPPPFIPQPTLGVGFRPYPMGELHVTCARHSILPLGSKSEHGRQKRTLEMSLPLGVRPHPPTYRLHVCNQLMGGNAIPISISHGSPNNGGANKDRTPRSVPMTSPTRAGAYPTTLDNLMLSPSENHLLIVYKPAQSWNPHLVRLLTRGRHHHLHLQVSYPKRITTLLRLITLA